MFADACPSGSKTYGETGFKDIDFTVDWEFAHLAENAYKYNLTVAQPETAPACNSYVGTSIERACINVSDTQTLMNTWLS